MGVCMCEGAVLQDCEGPVGRRRWRRDALTHMGSATVALQGRRVGRVHGSQHGVGMGPWTEGRLCSHVLSVGRLLPFPLPRRLTP